MMGVFSTARSCQAAPPGSALQQCLHDEQLPSPSAPPTPTGRSSCSPTERPACCVPCARHAVGSAASTHVPADAASAGRVLAASSDQRAGVVEAADQRPSRRCRRPAARLTCPPARYAKRHRDCGAWPSPWRLPASSPLPAQRMPTRLGNVLRAAELRPGSRYGLDAVTCWPRLWLLLPKDSRQEVAAARTGLYLSVQSWLCGVAFSVFVVWAWWAPVVGLTVAWVTYYTRMLAAARTYGTLIESCFDIHRGLLYAALNWPRPANPPRVRRGAAHQRVSHHRLTADEPDLHRSAAHHHRPAVMTSAEDFFTRRRGPARPVRTKRRPRAARPGPDVWGQAVAETSLPRNPSSTAWVWRCAASVGVRAEVALARFS